MNTIAKISTCLLFLMIVFSPLVTPAQICTFPGAECCGEGITNFQLDGTPAINRTSTVTENAGFTNTGVTTTVVRGQTYNYSITFPVEGNIVNCNTYNVKIYIDYNQNNLLTDTLEEAVSLSDVQTGTHTGSFTIPDSAMTGAAYMRVMMKMSVASLSGGTCGHSALTPCDVPADPVGFHGEVENYTLDITTPVGFEKLKANSAFTIYPNPASDVINIENTPSNLTPEYQIMNSFGQVCKRGILEESKIATTGLHSGLYFICLEIGEEIVWSKFIRE